MVDKAVANGMRGMAITDHGDMFGIKEFHDYVAASTKDARKRGWTPSFPSSVVRCTSLVMVLSRFVVVRRIRVVIT